MLTQRHRPGFTILELSVAMLLLGLTMLGVYPLVVLQSRQQARMNSRLSPGKTYYLVPDANPWARKLGAAARIQTTDPGPLPASALLVLDDGDVGYSENKGGWQTEKNDNAFGGSQRRKGNSAGEHSATWKYTSVPASWYEVRATWLQGTDRASDATYSVYDNSLLRNVFVVNQKNAPSGTAYGGVNWRTLGIAWLGSGTASVKLTDLANGTVCADGVWLVPLANVVQIQSLDRSLTSDSVGVKVSLTLKVPS
jgi:prepilin-type N-terminal cleavage/methylation domain-containing protein